MWVINRHQTSSELYAKLAVSYEQLNKIDQEQLNSTQNKQDRFEVSSAYEVDENDYQRVLNKFKSTDSNVRAHEQTHASTTNTTTPIQYNYQMGPDGKLYAVGGSVRVDTSIPDDPKEASYKLDKLKKSATSVDEMSAADSAISIQANLMKMKLELTQNSSY